MMSKSTRCAACKSMRRKCSKDCLLAPYFPSNNPQKFDCVHKIFGASNITKTLQQTPLHLRKEASEGLCYEASCRIKDPVYGCLGIISMLQQEIIQTESEIVKIKAQIAIYNAYQRQQQQEQQILFYSEKIETIQQIQVNAQQGLISSSNQQYYPFYGFNELIPPNTDANSIS